MNPPTVSPGAKKKKKKRKHSKSERKRRKLERERLSQSTSQTLSDFTQSSTPIHAAAAASYTDDPIVASVDQQDQETAAPITTQQNFDDFQTQSTDSTKNPIPPSKMECYPLIEQGLFVRDIQFVYPTEASFSMSTPTTPYTFTLLRKSQSSLSSNFEMSHQDVQNSTATPTIEESIEDILDSKRKRKVQDNTPDITLAQKMTTPKRNDDKIHQDSLTHSDSDNTCKELGNASILIQSSKDFKKESSIHEQQQEGGKRHKQSMSLLQQDMDDDPSFLNQGNHHRPLSGRTMEDAVRDTVGRRPRSNSTDGVLNLPQCGLCDEIRVLESHRWNPTVSSSRKGNSPVVDGQHLIAHCCRLSRPRGLVNLGNTCFLNATLQCLAYLPTFCQCVISLPNSSTSSSIQNQQGQKTVMTLGKKITMYMQLILGKMHGLPPDNTTSSIAPKALYSAIPLLSGSGRGYTFRPGRQEDAHEFLIHLLDTMQNGELQSAGINPKASGWRDRLPVPRLDETTFIHRVFGGYLRSQVICTLCGYKSNTYDPFLDLALEVNKSSTLMSALSQFMKKETLDAANKWKCSGCNRHVCATKQLTVFRPPLSLVVQLKRFVYGGQGMFPPHKNGFYGKFSKNGASRSKIQKPIDFSTALELPLSDGRRCEYYLTGIIIHEGSSANSGHYTACVRKPSSDHSRDEWYHMDDGSVTKVSENSVLQQKNAYVLFYSRKEVQLEIPRPPSRSFVSAEEAKKVGMARSKARADSLVSLEEGKSVHRLDHQILSKNSVSPITDNAMPLEKTFPLKTKMESSGLLVSNMKNDSRLNQISSSAVKSSPQTENNGLRGESNHRQISDSTVVNHNKSTSVQQPTRNENRTGAKDSRKSIKINRGVDTVEVFLHRGKTTNLWTPNTMSKPGKNLVQASLLGNRAVSTWDNDDEKDTANNQEFIERRTSAMNEISSQVKGTKRKMFLDIWDTNLDAGKRKKVKDRTQNSPIHGKSPSQNPFHNMQQKNMNGKKGFFPKNYRKK